MTTQEAVQALDAVGVGNHVPPYPEIPRDYSVTDDNTGAVWRWDGIQWVLAGCRGQMVTVTKSYTSLKPADAVAHLNELLSGEIDRFERDTSLRLAAVKVLRDKKAGDIFVKVQAHVR